MPRFWLHPLSALQPLVTHLFPQDAPCTCDSSDDPDAPCGACHALDEAFEASRVRTGPLLRCRLSDLLPPDPADLASRRPS